MQVTHENPNRTLIIALAGFGAIALIVIGVVVVLVPSAALIVPVLFTGATALGGTLLTLRTVGEVKERVENVKDDAAAAAYAAEAAVESARLAALSSQDNAVSIQKVHVMVNDHQTKMDQERQQMVEEVRRLNGELASLAHKLGDARVKEAENQNVKPAGM